MFLSRTSFRTLARQFHATVQCLSGKSDKNDFPSKCDVIIVGGGGMGSSIAYHLKGRVRDDLQIVVLERDKTYETASTPLSCGGMRQQFSIEENIMMSLYGAEFLQQSKQHFGDDVNVNFVKYGYLFLATEKSAAKLERNSKLQNRLGANNILLTQKKLKERFPWLNVDDLALGCFGLDKEGWFDPYSLLMGLKKKAQNLGVKYIDGEAVNFGFQRNSNAPETPNQITIKLNSGEEKQITFDKCVLAAGAWSGHVAKLLKIGTGGGTLAVPLPVEPRKRYVYTIKTQGENAPPLNSPLTIDPKSGTYFRVDGTAGNYICGRSPSLDGEPPIDNLDVDYDYFDESVWPQLAHRIPAFECAKVCSAWGGYYDFNTFDENGIIGSHPHYHNVYIATGFSGHGIQQAPAVGRAITELILDGKFTTIDLSRFGFERLIKQEPMFEDNIV